MNSATVAVRPGPRPLDADPAAALREAALVVARAFREIRLPAASPDIERRATLAYLAGVGSLVAPR